MIKLDEVTWYSQIVAIIFGAIIFGIGFYTGIEHHPQTTLNENDFEVPYMLEFCGGTYSTNQIKCTNVDSYKKKLKEKFNKMSTLTFVNVDWKNKFLSRKSIQLLAEKVMPKIK